MEGSRPRIEIGAIFQGRYEVLHELSEGGFGVVFKARQLTTGQPVAIKCLRRPSRDGSHKTYLERFRREMNLCAKLHHPNIVRLMDSGEAEGGLLYTVFEFIPGKDLSRVLAEEGRLVPQEAGHIMGQVLDALSCAHTLGIVHRDLKPGNIMVAHTGARRNALVLDFGIAAVISAAQAEGHMTLTAPMDRVGTPAYASPEQLRGKPATAQADLYAWGLVFLECLTGRRVVEGESIPDVIYRQLDPTPVPIPSVLQGHPLGELLRVVTSKDAVERRLTANEALRMLDACELSSLDLATQDPGSGSSGPRTPGASSAGSGLGQASTAEGLSAAMLAGTPMSSTDDAPTSRLPAVPEGERRQITAVSYSLHLVASAGATGASMDIDEQAELLSELKEICRERIRRSGGYVASAFGHRVLAFYGYPRASAEDALRAVHTGVEILRELSARNNGVLHARGARLEMRIGAHTGLVLVRGRPGALDPGDVFGDTPGVATQLGEGASPNTMVVSAATRRLIRSAFALGRGHSQQLDGGSRAVEVFDVEGRLQPASTPSSLGRASSVDEEIRLVGRREELALLERSWRLAQEGSGQAVLITGEVGIGKSRLTREIGLLVDEQKHAWIECRCMAEAQNSALRPIVDLLERRLGFHMKLSAEDKARRLESFLARYLMDPAEAMPLLAPLLSVPLGPRFAPLDAAPQRQRELTLRAVLALLIEIATQKPLLLVVEDLHWADPSTLELLALLLEAVPTTPTCVLLTARPEFEAPWRHAPVTRIQLGRLVGDSAQEMIDHVTGGVPLPEEVRGQVLRRTDGVPLFIEELTRTIIETGVVRLEGERYVLAGPTTELEIPSTLRDSLMARLDRLEPAAKGTAQLAAALGREFGHAEIHAVSPLSESQLQAALESLVRAELVHRRRRISGATYIFRHSLVQETAYDSLPRRSRQQYHKRIARVLEERFPEVVEKRPELLMQHHARAEDMGQALNYACRAARAALQRSANTEAIAHAQQALSWLPAIDDPTRRAEVELSLSSILSSAMLANYGYSNSSFEALMERTKVLVELVGENEDAFVIFWGIYGYHLARAQHLEAGEIAERYLERAEHAGDVSQQINALVLLGVNRYYRARFVEARTCLDRAMTLFDPEIHGDHALRFGYDTRCLGGAYRSATMWALGYPEQARQESDHVVTRAEELNHPFSLIVTLIMLAKMWQLEGRREATRDTARRIRHISERSGLARWSVVGDLMESWCDGDVARGEHALARIEKSGHLLRRPYWHMLVAETEAGCGRLDQAALRLRASTRMAEESEEIGHLVHLLRSEGGILARQGNFGAAEVRLREAVALARAQEARLLALQATTALARLLVEQDRAGHGRSIEARALLEEAYGWFTEGHDTPLLAEARALLGTIA